MSQDTHDTHAVAAAQDARSQADVDISTREGLAKWSQALSVTSEALESAVQAVGTRIDRIKNYLTTGMAGRQEDA